MLDECRPGLPVRSFDQHALGVVTGVERGCVRLAPRVGRPFWIDGILVRAVDANGVTLHVDRKSLTRYRGPELPSRGRFEPTSRPPLVSV